jgi:cytochrome oxidase Cu insertion factor (SCO1/SenC/PrrC family)
MARLMMKKVVVIILGAIILMSLLPGCATTTSSTEFGYRVGNKANDFTLKDLDGNTVTLSALFGRPVMINFWSTT